MTQDNNLIELPNSDTHNCFGCSRGNPHGLQMKFFAGGESVHSRITVPEHLCGWNTVIHGGILSTILDETMGWAGLYLLEHIVVTKTMTVEYKKPLYVGATLNIEGRIVGRAGDKEVDIAGTIHNEAGDICTASQGRFTMVPLRVAKRLRIISSALIDDFFDPLIKFKQKSLSVTQES